MESGLDHWPNASAFILIPMKVSVMELECRLMEKPFCLGAVFPVGMQGNEMGGSSLLFFCGFGRLHGAILISESVCGRR